MSNFQTYYFKLDFQKVDQHTGGKWLIHGTKRRKDNQLQSLELKVLLSNFSLESSSAHLDEKLQKSLTCKIRAHFY